MSKKKKTSKTSAARAVPERTAVVVLGMHRSGTSALAGVLSLLGCDRPAQEMAPNAFNEFGYFESQKLYALHNNMLGSAGSTWDDWTEFNPRWFDSPRAREFRIAAAEVLEAEFGTSPLFLIKDPRICRFVPFWTDVLAQAGCTVKVVHTHRNPLEVAASLENRDGLPRDLGVLIWLRHVLDAEFGSRGMSRVFTSYSHLLTDWIGMVTRIEAALDLSLPRMTVGTSREVDAFIKADLHHFDEPVTRVLNNPLLSIWVRTAFGILERWSAEGEDPEDHAVLDRLRTEFNSAVPAFDHLVETVRTDGARVADLDKRLTDSQRAVEEATSELATVRRASAKKIETAHAELQELRDDLSQTRSALEQRSAEAEDAGAALGQAEKNFNKRLAEAQHAVQEATSELATVRSASASEIDAARHELETAHAELQELRDDLSQTRSALEQRSAEAEEVGAALGQAEKEIVALTQKLDARTAENDGQTQKLHARSEELSRLTKAVIALESELDTLQRAAQTSETALRETREKLDRETAARHSSEAGLSAANARIAELGHDLGRLTKLSNIEKEEMVARILTLEAELGKEGAKSLRNETERARLADEARASKARAVQAETILGTREKDLQDSRVETERFKEELSNQVQRLESAEYAILALQSSTSWRLTAPLRKMRSLLRRT